jgi:NO-binding membrane sensor protein with MHYT domain
MNGSYDLGLVALSVLVAMLASYGALDFASRVALAPRNSSRVWVALGGCVMGFGIWSMHFIGMLAFSLPTRLAYDPALTAASLGIAILTSGFALAIVGYLAVMGRSEIDFAVLAAGGVLMGAGICAMHYTGMAAMRMTPPIIYAPLPYAASMVIAVVASIAALWLSFRQLSEPAGRNGVGHCRHALHGHGRGPVCTQCRLCGGGFVNIDQQPVGLCHRVQRPADCWSHAGRTVGGCPVRRERRSGRLETVRGHQQEVVPVVVEGAATVVRRGNGVGAVDQMKLAPDAPGG